MTAAHREARSGASRSSSLIAYVDGGARGNPGSAGFGVRLERTDGTLVAELFQSLGVTTNNVAEYRGLIAALEYAVGQGCGSVRIRSDSQLVVKQMRGEYRVKHPGLIPLYLQARSLMAQIETVIIEHVPREQNTDADRLANLAMDEAEARSAHKL
jgi:ribonuclease HI